jgi:hypothetical protein
MIGYAYFEQSAAWDSKEGKPDYQRVAGIELRLREWAGNLDLEEMLGLGASLYLGVHRPLDGEMKGRTVFTARGSVKL